MTSRRDQSHSGGSREEKGTTSAHVQRGFFFFSFFDFYDTQAGQMWPTGHTLPRSDLEADSVFLIAITYDNILLSAASGGLK